MENELLIDQMKQLVSVLNDYAYRYYVLDNPVVSDIEYDTLFDDLLRLEKETGVILEDSPTVRVGGKVLDGFTKHTHIAPLYSLGKSKTFEEVRDWQGRLGLRAGEKCQYTLEYKFDGLTINLTYDNGRLVMAATRGDGVTGEEILEQARTIKSIPFTIPFKGRMEVQGEAIIHLDDLAKYNETAKEPLKNARNAAAGALRNLDTKVTASRNLDVYFYNVGYIEGREFSTHTEMIEFLKENHFKVNDFERLYDSLEEVFEGIDEVEKVRDSLNFLIDGVVIKVNDFSLRERLGYTERFPRWAIAYKFPAEEISTTVNRIIWDVGRTGRITPVAEMDEVEIGGATIKRATLNNLDDIRRKKVGVGSRVFIRRSNDVIPEILGAVPGFEKEYTDYPKFCPYCGSEVELVGPNLYCPNTLSCKPQLVSRIVHYSSRDALNIEGLSDKTAELLYETIDIRDIAALYEISAEDLAKLPGFKEKKIEKLLDAIKASRNPELANFIFALGINNVGKKTAKDFAAKFGSFDNFRKASFDELVSIPDVGDIVAQSVIDFFASASVEATIERLIFNGVYPKDYVSTSGVFNGKKIVITGTLSSMKRSEAGDIIVSLGGELQSSVGKSTDILVVGENAGSKLEKARSLGIRVIDEEEFLGIINK